MRVQVEIIEGPLPGPGAPPRDAGGGAVVVFEGVVRPTEAGRPLRALAYEVYEPMATTVLQRLAWETGERHELLALHVQHSRGEVPVGATSFRLTVAAAHRAEALAAIGEFTDRMKQDAPIWKSPVYAEG